ncbi:MAG: hypothetical protein KGS60_11985 [Verrucomicrobia bacterium]|nr:hypothetical protein [Verrucomicrobiota bacterium]
MRYPPLTSVVLSLCLAGASCDRQTAPSPGGAGTPSAPAEPTKSVPKAGLTSALGSAKTAPEAPAANPATPAPPKEPSPEEVAKTVAALQKIDSVLRDSNLPPAKAGLQLAEMASDSSVPLQNRTEALQHAVNLLPDDGFGALHGLLSAPDAPVSLQDMVFNEVHNRPVTTQLPVALLLLKSQDPDVSSRARNLLRFHLDRDYGDDLGAWVKPTEEALAKAKGVPAPAP